MDGPKPGTPEFEQAVRQLLKLADELYPDEVDSFENELAGKLGLTRGPGCSDDQWRRRRVDFLNAQPEDNDDEGL